MSDKAPGLPCPECGFHIQVSIEMLLSGKPIWCTACGLKLEVDWEASSNTLKSLEQLQKGLREAERMRTGATPPPDVPGGPSY